MEKPNENLTPDFKQRFSGSFYGVLKWTNLDELWQKIKSQADADWYIYSPGHDVPESTVTNERLFTFIDEINDLLHKEHEKDYCVIVYVDDKDKPSFVKIFDPNNLGVSCGFSDNPPLPGWILSKIKPMALENSVAPTQSRQRWWNKIFS